MYKEKEIKDYEPKFLVVGPPRGGFTLLLSVINILYRDKNIAKDEVQTMINNFIPIASVYVDKVMQNFFKRHISLDELFYNKEFSYLVGGPKWIEEEDENTVCVRKYLGVKDMGDFTFIQYLPKFAMDFDEVVHSHSHPRYWTEDPYYKEYLKFSSIRNPIDIIHSSVYSINALTSEYIQRCINEKEGDIRLELALNKLTNMEFVEGLVKFLKRYLDEFIPVKDRFLYVMRWEDLIMDPKKTIMKIAKRAGMEITEGYAGRVWDEIDHRNLTRYHKHSFRKGQMNDWKNSITNSHLELFKSYGFNDYLEEFGYDRIVYFDEKDYTPIQRTIENYIKRGEIHKYRGDDDLYTFAFNKTNFVATGRYQFKTYPRNGGVKIEKSMFRNEAILLGFIEAMGPCLTLVSKFLSDVRKASLEVVEGNEKAFDTVEEKYRSKFACEIPKEEMASFTQAFKTTINNQIQARIPVLVGSYKNYNIVKMNKNYYSVPLSIGQMDLQSVDVSLFPEILRGKTFDSLRASIDNFIQTKTRQC